MGVKLLAGVLALVGGLVMGLEKKDGPATSSKVTYRIPHIGTKKINIDGLAKETAWKLCKPLKDFKLLRVGKAPEWTTEARLLWNDTNLYVFFDCVIDGIRTDITKRDDPVWNAECAEIFLCPAGADAVYYEFNFNPKNAIYDSRLETWKYEGQSKNWQKWAKEFNANIKSATTIRHDPADKDKVTGWTVEAAIPFKDLDVIGGKKPKADDIWLFNLFRIAVKGDGKMEFSHWQPVQPEFHRPHQFPRIKFVKE